MCDSATTRIDLPRGAKVAAQAIAPQVLDSHARGGSPWQSRATPGQDRPRLDYLDGLRAAAALMVLLLHSYEAYGLGLRLEASSPPVRESGALTSSTLVRLLALSFPLVDRLGRNAVPVFLVISGYCLMLPIVRSSANASDNSPVRFLARRARRILPPYFAALFISLLITAVVPGMNRREGVLWDLALPALDVRSIVAHIFLVQNTSAATLFTINPPMWSIAVEWQIYFLFPPLVLIWRTWGAARMLALALVLGALPVYLRLPILPLSHSWFVGLFAIGMAGASIGYGHHGLGTRWRERLPWGRIALCAIAVSLVAPKLLLRLWGLPDPGWIADYLLAVAVVATLICCAGADRAGRAHRALLLRGLQQPWLVTIGVFSYSLYLLHVPILALVTRGCRSLAMATPTGYAIIFALGMPAAILASYLFFLAFERPFLSYHAAQRVALPVRGVGASGRKASHP